MKYVLLKAPKCALDISDGSERAEYVPQKYLFSSIGRPHRAINLMYEYHPHDKNWPEKGTLINKLYKRNRRTNGYFPYMAFEKGSTDCEPFNQMRDIRKFGQDVQLTMTLDLNLSDEELIKIAKDLSTFGYLEFRINHECNGHWFTFNRENTYKEVSDFFIRFHNILRKFAPNVITNACFNGIRKSSKDPEEHMGEDKLAPMFRCADILSFDLYHSLHWGWPHDGYNPVKKEKFKVKKIEKAYQISYEEWWDSLYSFVDLMLKVNKGKQKDIYLCEINTDADVVGLEGQARWIEKFYAQIKKKNHSWLKGITYYQFRDRGGLGLEYELDENKTKRRANPSLESYKKIAQDDYFSPKFEKLKEDIKGEAILEWTSTRNVKGILIEEENKGYKKCEIELGKDKVFLIYSNKMWFYKDKDKEKIDISESLKNNKNIEIMIFAPPTEGENTLDKSNPNYLKIYKIALKEPLYRLF